MSDYRTKVGKLQRLVKFSSKDELDNNLNEWSEKYLEYYFDAYIDEYDNLEPFDLLKEFFESSDRELFIANDSIWLISNCESVDENDSYCNLTEIDGDEFEFRTRFYDGGTYEGEMIRDEIERLKL